MTTRARLLQRLDAVAAIVRPRHSFAYRVAKLPDDMRDRFGKWAADQAAHVTRLEAEQPGSAYAAAISGNAGPAIPPDIATALKLTTPIVTADVDAAELYRRQCEQ